MKRALGWVVVSLLAVGCAGDAGGAPPKSAESAAPAPAAAAPAPSEAPPAAASSEPAAPADSADSADDAAWSGEAEAKAEKAPAGKTETRTMEVIAQVVKDNRQPVRDCFDKAKKDLPDLKGDMVIHFVIDPEGKVKKAELNIERSTLKSPAVVDCAVKVVLGIKFPPSSRGMDTTVNYPYNLN